MPRCRGEADLSYMGHGICSRHWNELTNESAPPDALRMTLGIGEVVESETEETPMSKSKKPATKSETNGDSEPAEASEAATTEAMETKQAAAKQDEASPRYREARATVVLGPSS